MQRITSAEVEKLNALTSRLGSTRFRTLMTPSDSRLLRPERLQNLATGRGRLSQEEVNQLRLISSNSKNLENLAVKGERLHGTGLPYKINRALRDWLITGKEKGTIYKDQDKQIREQQLKAIKALRYFGVEPSDGHYYVRRMAV